MLIVKVGGGDGINWNYVCRDFASLTKTEEVILVHGASSKRDRIAAQLGYPTRTVVSPSGISSVFTDQKALEIFLMVYAGLVNKNMVAKLQQLGVNAIGLSGVDGKLWVGKRKSNLLITKRGKTKLLKDNYTGRVEKINTVLIRILLDNGYIPVVCPPALSFAGEIVNVDNDLTIATMAGELGVKKIVVLFEAPGLLRHFNDQSSLVKQINRAGLDDYLQFAVGRMKKKILGAKRAFELGVETIYWGDGRIKNPITKALSGEGTVISAK